MTKWLLIALGAVVAGAGVATNLVTGGWGWFWGLVGVVALVASSVIGVRTENSRQQAQEDYKVTVGDQFQPLARELVRFTEADPDTRLRMLDGVVMSAVACASGVADSKRVRATFMYRDDANPDRPVLRPGRSVGRGDRPQSSFARDVNSEEGTSVWRAAEADEDRFCRDVQKDPPPGWEPGRKRGYRTFLTVPIRVKNRVEGLLTVNAVKPGDLTETDVGTVRVIASLVCAALSLVPEQDRVGGTYLNDPGR